MPVVVAGTGYTGEDGVEIAVPAERAGGLWLDLGAGIVPAGLGARDTLRLEAGLPLHGHELGPGITPLQAGLGWVVRWDKGDFRGREPLAAEKERGIARRLRGIATEGRRPPRSGQRVLVDGDAGRGGDERQLQPRARPRHRPRLRPPDVEEGARRRGRGPRGPDAAGPGRPLPFVGKR